MTELCPFYRGFDAPRQCTRGCRGFQCQWRGEQNRHVLELAKAKAEPRRFTGETPTGFGELDDPCELGRS